MTSHNAEYPGLDFWQPHWQQFVTTYREWIEERHSESLELFYIPPTAETAHGARTLYGIASAELEAENAFAALCRRFNLCGVELASTCATHAIVRWIKYDRLHPWQSDPEDSVVNMCREFGRSDEFIALAKIALKRVEDLADRLPSIAGRLCCLPQFRSERDDIRTAWLDLPNGDRPKFPLQRSLQVLSGTTLPQALCDELRLQPASNQISQFQRRLEQFLEEWQLQSMETWELPQPQGPHWPDFQATDDQRGAGTIRISTPVRFPVLNGDDIGRPAREQHQREAQECGIEDEAKWKVYAELFRIGFWELVLRQRYARKNRAKRFTEELESVLGEIVGLSAERARRLRAVRSSLISGRQTSLMGLRC